jgi:hypothetical protein
MSTFTDWNGPGCGNGNTLPQVNTLEQLILKVSELHGYLDHVRHDLQDHVADSVGGNSQSVVHGILNRLSALDSARQNVEAQLQNEINAEAQARANMDVQTEANANTYTDNKVSTTSTADRTYTNSKLEEAKAYSDLVTAALNTFIAALKQNVVTDSIAAATQASIAVGNLLRVTQGILGAVYPDKIIDFKNMELVVAPIAAITGTDTQLAYPPKNAVGLIGVLSDDWDNTSQGNQMFSDSQYNHNNQGIAHKPARAYLKFIDDKPWNAIIDMVYSKRLDTGTGATHNGSISGICAKTKDRPYLTFGLYTARSNDEKEHVYLGMKAEDIAHYASTTPSGSIYTILSGFKVYVGGVNFKPITPALRPNSAVTEVTSSAWLVDGAQPEWDQLIVGTVYSDNYRDKTGHGVAITDEANKVLRIGAAYDDINDPDYPNVKVHQVNIYSAERPNVYLGAQEYQMAFLQDFAQSIYWQRNVAAVVDKLADLQVVPSTIGTADDKTVVYELTATPGTYVSRQFADDNPTLVTGIPGIYLVDPASETGNIPVYIFAEGDVALVKDGGTTVTLADGKYNGVLDTTGDKENDPALVNDIPMPPAVGAWIKDNNGIIAEIEAFDGATGKFSANVPASPPIGTVVTIPAYVTFKSGAWDKVNAEPINVPTTSDGHIHDITYEWAGLEGKLSRITADGEYFNTTYVLWTAAHTNDDVYPEFGKDPWSDINFNIAGYRSQVRQDEIDTALQVLATTQADYADREPVLNDFALPEHAPAAIPNPAYIHHKPWIGTSVFDGGAFTSPPAYNHWYVDGGDFTGLAGQLQPGAIPAGTEQEKFRNMIMRLWHGDLADMPEYKTATPPILVYEQGPFTNTPAAILSNFQRTFRWIDDMNMLIYSDGTNMWRFIPVDTWSSDYKVYGPNLDRLTPTAKYDTLVFTYNANGTMEVSSPRLDKLEAIVVYNEWADTTFASTITQNALPDWNVSDTSKTMPGDIQTKDLIMHLASQLIFRSAFFKNDGTQAISNLRFGFDTGRYGASYTDDTGYVGAGDMDFVRAKEIDYSYITEITAASTVANEIDFEYKATNVRTQVETVANAKLIASADFALTYAAGTMDLALSTAFLTRISDIEAELTTATADISTLRIDLTALTTKVDDHIADTANPHSVTKAQVGLGSVDDTSDADKPISDAQAIVNTNVNAELVTHATDIQTAQAEIVTLQGDVTAVDTRVTALEAKSNGMGDPTSGTGTGSAAQGTLAYVLDNPPTTGTAWSLNYNTASGLWGWV